MSDYENLLNKCFSNKMFQMFSLRMEEIRRNPLQGSVPSHAVTCSVLLQHKILIAQITHTIITFYLIFHINALSKSVNLAL